MDNKTVVYGLIVFGLAVLIAVQLSITGNFINSEQSNQVRSTENFVYQSCVTRASRTYEKQVNPCTTIICLRDAMLDFRQAMDDCQLQFVIESTNGWDASTVIDSWDAGTIIDCGGIY